MRTSKEMADAVLKARDVYEEENRKRKGIITKTAGIAAVACSFCIMGGVLLYFNSNSPDDPGKIVEVTACTETEAVTNAVETVENVLEVNETESVLLPEETAVTEAPVSVSVSDVTEIKGTDISETSSETAKENSTQKPSETEKKNDGAAVTEKAAENNKPEKPQTTLPEKKTEPVKDNSQERVTEMIVTRTAAEKVNAKDDEGDEIAKADQAPVVVRTEEKDSPQPSSAQQFAPVPEAAVNPSVKPSVMPEPQATKEAAPRTESNPAESPASPQPCAAARPEPELECSTDDTPASEATSVIDSTSQANFDEIINFTVVNNTDCYLYYKDNDQILVILCHDEEDVQKINDLISEKGFDPSKFECRVNDIVIDLPAQKTDDMEKQRKQISRFMTQNDIYGYAKIEECDGEDKIIVMLNDASSENAAKIRYFLSMYSISFNSVKINSI